MQQPQFHIGIKNNVTADMNDGVCELYFLNRIENPTYYDWESGEDIEGSLLSEVISQMRYYNPKKVCLYIDNLGGNANVGWGVYNYIKDSGLKVETKILNSCGSISTVIAFAAGKGKITMPKYGLYAIHQAENIGIGRASDLRAAADLAEKNTKMMLDLYVSENRKGKTYDELAALIADGDYWMTGEEAKDMGFVDDCYNDTSITVTASIAAAKDSYKIPQRILDMMPAEEVTADVEHKTLKEQFMELKNFVTAAIDKIKGNKVDPKSANLTADIAEAIAQPLSDMVDEIQTNVTAELTNQKEAIVTELTTVVTAAMDAKYKETVDGLTQTVANLTADLERVSGKAATSADTNNGKGGDKPTMRVVVRD